MNKIQYAYYSDIGGREENEDSIGILKKPLSGKHLFVVADGLGGHGGGKQASASAISSLQEKWNGDTSEEEWKRLIALTHKKVVELQTDSCQMKSTVVGLMLSKNRASWAHVGDSRLYHFFDGKLIFQTRDHSASQLAVMLGDIQPEEIRFHKARNHVLKALGQADVPVPDCKEVVLEKGNHAFLLCTDGFWEYVTEEEMEQALSASSSPQKWLDQMRHLHNTHIQPQNDNHSAICIFLRKI